MAAKRARQINSYYHNLGEGTFEEFPPPMIDTGSKNYLTIALEEVAAGRSSTATAAEPEPGTDGGDGAHPPRRHRRDRGLQGARAHAPGHRRPATRVRVIQTEASTRFVGTASFAGITGAPVLITEWEPDPLRGAFPGDPPPAHAPLSHLELVAARPTSSSSPRPRRTRSPSSPPGRPTTCSDRRRARLPAPADRRARR